MTKQTNQERLREQKRKHYRANREYYIAKAIAYDKANPRDRTEYMKEYRKKNAEKLRQKRKERYQKQKEKMFEQILNKNENN